MKEKDRFCLVSYASDVTVDMPLTHMSKEEKESAKVVVNGLRATTSTALCDGLITGERMHSSWQWYLQAVKRMCLVVDYNGFIYDI